MNARVIAVKVSSELGLSPPLEAKTVRALLKPDSYDMAVAALRQRYGEDGAATVESRIRQEEP